MKKIISFVIVLCLMLSIGTAYASPLDQPVSEDTKVSVTGNIKNAEIEGQKIDNIVVTLLVLKKTKTIDDLKNALKLEENAILPELLNVICFFDETKTNETGDYAFKFIMDENETSGEYAVLVGGSPFESNLSGVLVYVPTAEKIKAVEAINSALDKTPDDLNSVFETYKLELLMSSLPAEIKEFYEDVKAREEFLKTYKEFGDYNIAKEEINTSLVAIIENLRKAVIIQKIEIEDDITKLETILNTYHTEINLDISYITEANKQEVLTQLAKLKNITNAEIVKKDLTSNSITFDFKNSSKWGDIRNLLALNKDYLKINFDDKGCDYNEVYHKLFNIRTQITGIDDLGEKFKKIVLETRIKPIATPTPPSTGGGGGGGGGGSIGNVAPPISVPPMVDDQQKEDPSTEETPKFDDVTMDFWAEKYISRLAKDGIMKGKDEKTFAPNSFITREEFVAVLLRGLAFELTENDPKFTDVSKDDWFYKYVATAKELGITSGFEDGSFGVSKNITRQDMAVMTTKAIQIKKIELETIKAPEFADELDISDYAKEAVNLMKNSKIINGNENNEFLPNNNTTRAEVAKIICMII